MNTFFHSVTLDKEKCMGCINCIKRCPTEAIRVRNKKAMIIAERCIDCGECIRVCPHHAKKAIYDSLDVIKNYKYTIALPAPALYAQFNNLEDVDIILNALLDLGFDSVYEVAKAAEIVSDATRKYMARENIAKPVISSACPAVTRLIRVRFPSLIDHILPLNAPVEVAARLAKEEAAKKTGLDPQEIGAIFISPCPAKVTASKMPLGTSKSEVSAVVAISDIYPKLLKYMKIDMDRKITAESGKIGVSWANSSGEASALLNDNYLAADGIENVIRVLEDLEDEKFEHLDFIELNACNAGCIGGVMTVENPYIARTKLKRLRKYLPVSLNHINNLNLTKEIEWDSPIEYTPVLKLDEDIEVAMEKMSQMEKIKASLPGLDCGSCGSPSCKALAEDVVRGVATPDECIYKFRENISSLVDKIQKLDLYIPDYLKSDKE
ncbi:[Fe-Fe] hydrogenase large subunit C-terminal domain-containing protein [Paludicola sp. MB14-C6]|uniref:[Fe-Fe] hydrogenase large subunit C-terminal domain-containing protein n=1 Tax=Paludihabitans sp. MB14-C6 TaxID=3070656 RepID=UPI0027DB4A7B|nr:[Fe-Fe] hydrogenase large subunit C-terminal domain-containing protein [Paludicola sp. MB14-C6]WMJ23423.1 [Fe-Fe] hydrogenase large subunit C-terminal domain-containing protein [Paludicola sp. MB14-C6]